MIITVLAVFFSLCEETCRNSSLDCCPCFLKTTKRPTYGMMIINKATTPTTKATVAYNLSLARAISGNPTGMIQTTTKPAYSILFPYLYRPNLRICCIRSMARKPTDNVEAVINTVAAYLRVKANSQFVENSSLRTTEAYNGHTTSPVNRSATVTDISILFDAVRRTECL